MPVGVTVTATEVPAAVAPTNATGNAFVIGLGDWGAASGANTPVACHSITDVSNTIGPRSSTNATLFDALDAFFHEGGSTAYVGRVVGPNPTNATLTLQDASSATAVTLTAQFPGNYGNQIQVAVNNSGASVVITVTDTYGSTLATSPALTTNAAIVTWAATTGYITAVAGAGGLPKTIIATSLSGGSDNRGSATLVNWTNALNNFQASLGPGQVLAPGQTATTNPGVWAALGQHGLNNNRVALCDVDDGLTASAAITSVGTSFNALGAGPMGFWAGSVLIPGVVPSTTRTVFPSSIIAALCARADANGNPNIAAAGTSFPLNYVLGSASFVSGNTSTYSQNDINNLNAAGINTFATRNGAFSNYGFVSSLLSTTDPIYWQLNHLRMKMALANDATVIGQPFVFSQIDGTGGDIASFAGALAQKLTSYYRIGALYGNTAGAAFSVDTSPAVNTPATIAAGQLNATVYVRLSPFAQQVQITLSAVPVTQSVPPAAQ